MRLKHTPILSSGGPGRRRPGRGLIVELLYWLRPHLAPPQFPESQEVSQRSTASRNITPSMCVNKRCKGVQVLNDRFRAQVFKSDKSETLFNFFKVYKAPCPKHRDIAFCVTWNFPFKQGISRVTRHTQGAPIETLLNESYTLEWAANP